MTAWSARPEQSSRRDRQQTWSNHLEKTTLTLGYDSTTKALEIKPSDRQKDHLNVILKCRWVG